MLSSDKYLIEKKEKLLQFILLFFTTVGVPILMAQLMGGQESRALAQAVGLGVTAVITLDYLLRKNVSQTAIMMTFHGLLFLSYRYYNYFEYNAPSLIWFTVIAPSMAWLTNRKIAIMAFIATLLALLGVIFSLYFKLKVPPTPHDFVYIMAGLFVSGYFTYLISETESLYEETVRIKVKGAKDAIHKNQLYTLGEFAGNLAHEMNNPFQVIKGNASILSRKLEKMQDEDAQSIRKYATNIDRTVDRTKKLIDGLLRLSRFPSEELTLSYFKFNEVWNLVFPLLETKIRNSPAQIALENDQQVIYGQKDFLAQVILNLLNNALYEIQNQKDAWIKIRVKDHFIDISDSGNGVTEEERTEIFTPFYSTKQEKGTGLGLPLCLSIMNQMKGDLYLSENTKNTTFRIVLPKEKLVDSAKLIETA